MSPHYLVKDRTRSLDQSCIVAQKSACYGFENSHTRMFTAKTNCDLTVLRIYQVTCEFDYVHRQPCLVGCSLFVWHVAAYCGTAACYDDPCRVGRIRCERGFTVFFSKGLRDSRSGIPDNTRDSPFPKFWRNSRHF